MADTPLSESLQQRINKIAQTAKQRNPNGYTLTPPRKILAAKDHNVYAPFVTVSGQPVLFYNGTFGPRLIEDTQSKAAC